AQTSASTPLALGGYNQDVLTAVSESAASPFGTTVGVDNNSSTGGWSYFERGYPGAIPGTGLPTTASGRTFTGATNPQATFQLQPYVGNNALYVPANGGTAST